MSVTWAQTADDAATATPKAVELEPIQVVGEGGPGDPLPEAYPGGQVARGGRIGVLGNESYMDAPFSASSYTEELIRHQQAETIGDVLANDPSVRSGYSFGNFGEQFVIRGFTLSGEDIAIDGLYGDAPRQIVSTEMFERVEVLKGASAFLNGMPPAGGGLGGTVNLVPKRAGDEDLTRVTATYENSFRPGVKLDASRRFGPDKAFGLRFNGAYRDGETAIEDEDRKLGLAAIAFDYRGEDFRATVDAAYHQQRVDQGRPIVQLAGPDVPEAPDANSNFAAPWSYSEMTDIFGQARLEYDVTDSVMLYAVGGARIMREDGDYASASGATGSGDASMSRLTVPREDFNISGMAGLRAKFATGLIGHSVNAGGSALRTENRNSWTFGGSTATNIYDPVSVPYPATSFASGDMEDLPLVSRSELTSLFLSDTLTAFGDRVHLTLGARQQWIDVEGFDRATGAQTANYEEQALSPFLGLAVNVTDEVTLYANRIEGLSQGPEAPSTAANPGEIFEPYVSTQYEVGGKVDFGRFGTGIALFQTSVPVGFTDPATNVYGVDGEQRNRGIELTVFGEPFEGFRALGGVTLLDAELTSTAGGANDGNSAIGAPDYQINLGVEWDAPFAPGFTIGGRMLHTAAQYADAANTQKVPAWTRFDLNLRYEEEIEGTPVAFNLVVENIANESYWASATGGYLTQGDPLTAKLSISADF